MNDDDIDSRLLKAGYTYDLATGRYVLADGEDDQDFATEDIADELHVSVDELLAWEERQQQADQAMGD